MHNIKYQIPDSTENWLNSYVEAQLPQNSNATQKKVEVVLPGRLDFVHVFEPWAFRQNYEPKFFVTLIIDKSDINTFLTIRNAINQAYDIGKWKLQVALQDIRYPLRDGDTEKSDNLAYKNCWFINATRSGEFGAPPVCDIYKKKSQIEVSCIQAFGVGFPFPSLLTAEVIRKASGVISTPYRRQKMTRESGVWQTHLQYLTKQRH